MFVIILIDIDIDIDIDIVIMNSQQQSDDSRKFLIESAYTYPHITFRFYQETMGMKRSEIVERLRADVEHWRQVYFGSEIGTTDEETANITLSCFQVYLKEQERLLKRQRSRNERKKNKSKTRNQDNQHHH